MVVNYSDHLHLVPPMISPGMLVMPGGFLYPREKRHRFVAAGLTRDQLYTGIAPALEFSIRLPVKDKAGVSCIVMLPSM